MTVTTSDRGQQNIFAKEPEMTYVENYGPQTHNEKAEVLNSRFAMLGFTIGIISKITTGSFFFFGLFN
jgi:hypothetical protein